MGLAIDEVNYEGVFWKDIDWSKPEHVMKVCDSCGIDGDEEVGVGHQSACRYLQENQQTPAGRAFLREKIRDALVREGRILDGGSPARVITLSKIST